MYRTVSERRNILGVEKHFRKKNALTRSNRDQGGMDDFLGYPNNALGEDFSRRTSWNCAVGLNIKPRKSYKRAITHRRLERDGTPSEDSKFARHSENSKRGNGREFPRLEL